MQRDAQLALATERLAEFNDVIVLEHSQDLHLQGGLGPALIIYHRFGVQGVGA